MSTGMWILILVGAGASAGLALLWRGADARAVELADANGKLTAEREDLKARLSRETQGRKRQAEDLSTFRKKAEKTKKRQSKGAPDQPMGTASRISDLESELERAVRERDQGKREREQLTTQVAHSQTQLAHLQTQLEASAKAAEAIRTAPEPVVPPAPLPPGVEDLQRQLSEESERVAKLQSQLVEAKASEARTRKRMSNQEQLYASIRSELDVKKDRLRTQEEQIQRLQALKAAVAD
jgi:DNA repair exonuclease SbcCD ATPase subunit